MNKRLRGIIAFGITLGAVASFNLFASNNLNAYADNDDADEISTLDIEESDGDDIDLYEDDDYDDEVEDDLEVGKTYYGESDTKKITIDTDDVDEDYVRIFFKNKEYELGDKITLSSGTNTLKVRVYEDEYDDDEKYSSSDYNQYTLKIEYDDDDDDDDDELDEVDIEDDNGKELTIYTDDDYDEELDDDLDDDETYYVKSSTKEITIDNDDIDDDLVRIVKGGSDYELGDSITLSSGVNTIKVRVYEDEDDDDDDYDCQYIFKVEYDNGGSTTKVYTTEDTNKSDITTKPQTPDTDFVIVPSSSTGSTNYTSAYGWKYSNGLWYYIEPNGTFATGWKFIDGNWYYMDGNGIMQTGWRFVNGNWYYLESSGKMHTGWIKDNGSWYYLYTNGSMAKNTVIAGYKLGSSGAWIR